MKNFDFSTYLSPFTWRYGSAEMRYIFSEQYKVDRFTKNEINKLLDVKNHIGNAPERALKLVKVIKKIN